MQKNIDDYEEKNKDIKVRNNSVYFKFITLITVNETNMHYSKHGLKEIFVADEENIVMLNNKLIDDFETLKEIYGEDSPNLIQTKKQLDLLLQHNYKTNSRIDDILVK